jgi:hypothetical protein
MNFLDQKQERFMVRPVSIAAASAAILFSSAALAQQSSPGIAPIPDFSGQWGRDMLFFEPPASGPGPVVNSVRKPDGTIVESYPETRGRRSRQEVRRLARRWYGVAGPAQFVLA